MLSGDPPDEDGNSARHNQTDKDTVDLPHKQPKALQSDEAFSPPHLADDEQNVKENSLQSEVPEQKDALKQNVGAGDNNVEQAEEVVNEEVALNLESHPSDPCVVIPEESLEEHLVPAETISSNETNVEPGEKITSSNMSHNAASSETSILPVTEEKHLPNDQVKKGVHNNSVEQLHDVETASNESKAVVQNTSNNADCLGGDCLGESCDNMAQTDKPEDSQSLPWNEDVEEHSNTINPGSGSSDSNDPDVMTNNAPSDEERLEDSHTGSDASSNFDHLREVDEGSMSTLKQMNSAGYHPDEHQEMVKAGTRVGEAMNTGSVQGVLCTAIVPEVKTHAENLEEQIEPTGTVSSSEVNAVHERTSLSISDNVASSETSGLAVTEEEHLPATGQISKHNVEHDESVKPPHEAETVSIENKAVTQDTSNNAHCVNGSDDRVVQAPGGTGFAGSDGQGFISTTLATMQSGGDPPDKDGNSARHNQTDTDPLDTPHKQPKALQSDEAFSPPHLADDEQNVKENSLQSEGPEQKDALKPNVGAGDNNVEQAEEVVNEEEALSLELHSSDPCVVIDREVKTPEESLEEHLVPAETISSDETNVRHEEKITSSNMSDNAASSETSILPVTEEKHLPNDQVKIGVHNNSVEQLHDVETASNESKAVVQNTSNNAECLGGDCLGESCDNMAQTDKPEDSQSLPWNEDVEEHSNTINPVSGGRDSNDPDVMTNVVPSDEERLDDSNTGSDASSNFDHLREIDEGSMSTLKQMKSAGYHPDEHQEMVKAGARVGEAMNTGSVQGVPCTAIVPEVKTHAESLEEEIDSTALVSSSEINAVHEPTLLNISDSDVSSETSGLSVTEEEHLPATGQISKHNVEHDESVKPPHDVETVSNESRAVSQDTSNNAHCVDRSGDKALGGTGAACSNGQGLKAGPEMATPYKLGTPKIKYIDDICVHNGMFTGIYDGYFEAGVKVIKLTECEEQQATCSEVKALRTMSNQHDNVIHYLAKDIVKADSGNFLLLAVEWCQYDLTTVLTNRYSFPVLTTNTILDQLAKGLRFIHHKEIVHLNIKPTNILVKQCNEPKCYRIKISNFANARFTESSTFSLANGEEISEMTEWAAPEIIKIIRSPEAQKQIECKNSCDIYSLGLVFFCVLSSERRLGESDDYWKAWLNNVHGFIAILHKPADISDGVVNLESHQGLEKILVNKMLAHEERPSLNQILQDPVLWDSSQMLSFIDMIDGHLKVLRQGNKEAKDIVALFEDKTRDIFVIDGKELWKESLPNIICEEMFPKKGSDHARTKGDKRPKYNPKSTLDLLRAIRNHNHHFYELPDDVKSFYGNHPDGYLNSWKLWFPNLLPVTVSVTYSIFKEGVDSGIIDTSTLGELGWFNTIDNSN